MKDFVKGTFIVVITVFFLGCNSTNKKEKEQEGYRVYGTLEGVEDGSIALNLYNPIDRTSKIIDSTTITDGTFEFTGKIEHPDAVFLSAGNSGFQFLLENEEIKIVAEAPDSSQGPYAPMEATITGSPLNDLYQEQKEREEAILNADKYEELNKLNSAYREAQQDRDIERAKQLYEEMEELADLSEERSQELISSKIDFINQHPESPAAPLVLGYSFGEMNMPFSQMEEVFHTFSGNAKNTLMYKYFEDEYNSIKRMSPGAKAPDFTLKSPTGEEISLSDIQDKYILVDFWASWCKPCRESYPHLKEVYKKYKDAGFEVLAVSTDTDHEKWKNAIKEDQTKWIQVVDTFSRPGFPSDISTLYAVPFLPTTYLLDKNKIIIAKNLSEQELDKKLKEIFGF